MPRAMITQVDYAYLVLIQIACERILGNDMDYFLWFLLCASYGGTTPAMK
jgi:hypothetical protein